MSEFAMILDYSVQLTGRAGVFEQPSGTHAARTRVREREPGHWLLLAETTPEAQSIARARLNRWPSRARGDTPAVVSRCPACGRPWDGEGVCDDCVDAMLAAQNTELRPEYPPLLMPIASAPSVPLTYVQRIAARREAVSHEIA